MYGDVVINEIHYHPVEEPVFRADFSPSLDLSEDVHEFIEIHNTSTAEVSLDGWEFTKGISYTFPMGTTIEGSGYLLVAKHPQRIQSIPSYEAVNLANIYGPWSGGLKNSGERIVLTDQLGQVVDDVTYQTTFPWPVTADGLGETRRWEGLDLDLIQYRGSSLERVSASYSGNAPENWRASDPLTHPTPGMKNTIVSVLPDPIVTFYKLRQSSDGEPVIRPSESATLTCAFSSEKDITEVIAEYFIDDLNSNDEIILSVPMVRKVLGERILYCGILPAQTAQQIIRYRIKATRSSGNPILSPRADDPFIWHAYCPWEGRTNGERYEIYFSEDARATLSRNLTGLDPNRLPDNAFFGESRSKGWNGTAPGIFVRDGEVWDIHWRYQGSPFFRWTAPFTGSVPRMKIKFPRDHRLDEERSILLTYKENETLDAHRLFQFLGLPISTARRVSITANGGAPESMIQIGDMNDTMLDQYAEREEARNDTAIPNDNGWIVKASGLFNSRGPWGTADGVPLFERAGYEALERYAWTYPLKNDDWRGYLPFDQMLQDHPGDLGTPSELQSFYNTQWDVAQALNYYATAEWMGIWDDKIHNYFYYRTPSGQWMILPWDFDDVFSSRGLDSHAFEPTIKEAFSSEYQDRLFKLNNTLFHHHNLTANKITFEAAEFAITRRGIVNQIIGEPIYTRPDLPSLVSPAESEGHHPESPFESSIFSHSEGNTHHSTLWEFRTVTGDYLNPVFRQTSTTALTKLTLPKNTLRIGETYFWRVTYLDDNNHESLLSHEQSFIAGGTDQTPGAIRFSEVVAHNSSTTEHDGQFPDWVEIQNIIGRELPLGGIMLQSDPNGPSFTFPQDTIIPAQGRLIVWLTEAPINATGLYSGFGIAREGDTLTLLTTAGAQLDSITFGPQPDSTSLSKFDNAFWRLSIPTPLADNIEAPLATSSALRITEWLANPSDGDDWLELYNTSFLPVALEGVSLQDSTNAQTALPALSFLGGYTHLQLFANGTPEKGANHLGFSLSSEREEIFLRAADNSLIDQAIFWDQQEGISEGHLRDLVSISRFSTPTPGLTNFTPDRDSDGIPDSVETAQGLDPDDPNDAFLDPDGDHFTNAQEYLANTNPFDGEDFLYTTIQPLNGNVITLNFRQKADRIYFIEKLTTEGEWHKVKSYPLEQSAIVRDEDLTTYGSGIYRVGVLLP